MGVWQIAKKDLRLLIRDRRALVVLVALPLIFIAILGFSTGRLLGWRSENQRLNVTIVDQDESELSTRLVTTLQRRDGMKVVEVDRYQQAQDLLKRRKVAAVVVIGPQFHERAEELSLRDILQPEKGKLSKGLSSLDLEVESTPAFAHTEAIVREMTFAEALRVLAPHLARRNPLTARIVGPVESGDEAEETNKLENADVPDATDEEMEQGDNLVYMRLVPSYTVMFVFFLVNIMARSILAERELGTLRRLKLAPVSNTSVIVGKNFSFFVISLAQTVILFLCGKFLFGMTWGTMPWLLIPVIMCTSLSATALGLLVATLVRTDSQVSAFGNFLVITMAGISGCFLPRDWLPELMQQVSLVTPHAWALIAYEQILSGGEISLPIVWQCCGMLLIFTGLYAVFGWWRFGLAE